MAFIMGITLLTMIVSAAMIGFSLTHRERSKTIYFIVLNIAVWMYTFGYMLEITSSDLYTAIVALKVENVGIPMLAPFFMLMVFSICGYQNIKPWMGISAAAYSFFMFLVVLFNEFHYLYYTSYEWMSNGSWHYMVMERGPIYVFNQAVVFACTIAAYVAIYLRFHTWSRKIRIQMQYVIWGSLVTFVANVCNFAGVVPHGLDITPFACLVGLGAFSVSIFRYKLFDIIPQASEEALKTMDDAMIILDNDWYYLFSNESAVRLFPDLRKLKQGDSFTSVDGWPQVLMDQQQPGQASFEMQVSEGTAHTYRAHISAIGHKNSLLGWSIVIRDTTQTTMLMQQLEVLATTDPLTNIYNRRHFDEMVQRELELAKRHPHSMAMIMFDLDHFKVINDTYGHPTGDKVLQSVVATVANQLRPYDIFARFGGEEFVIFAMYMDITSAESLAWRLCRSIAKEKIKCDGVELSITASFGVTEMRAWDTIEEAVAAVDKALYRAKTSGRNCVVVIEIDRGAPTEGHVVDLSPDSYPIKESNEK